MKGESIAKIDVGSRAAAAIVQRSSCGVASPCSDNRPLLATTRAKTRIASEFRSQAEGGSGMRHRRFSASDLNCQALVADVHGRVSFDRVVDEFGKHRV